MVKNLLTGLIIALSVLSTSAQENHVRRLPDIEKSGEQKIYTDKTDGFWIAAEASGAYSCRLYHSNFGLAEVDVTAGYRFNEYFRCGIGVGARYYFDNDKVRFDSSEWACPIYANVRGNIIPTMYRNVVPFYSFDIGGSIRDGFMIRPVVGIRVGQARHAFLLGLGYLGQNLKSYDFDESGKRYAKGKFVSFITLRLGYEF